MHKYRTAQYGTVKTLVRLKLTKMYVHKKFQTLRMCPSQDMVAFVPPFWKMATFRTFRVSVRDNRGFNIF